MWPSSPARACASRASRVWTILDKRQGAQRLLQCGVDDHADTPLSSLVSAVFGVGVATTVANSRDGPCRNAAAPPSPAGAGTGSASSPAARMPLIVR